MHAFYLDTLYNDYLFAAGEITTEQQEQALVVEMLQQYCDRVARYSTAGYSVVIRNIIHYINLHLKEDLTLSTLAARFNLSRSYLSDRFHREVHSNLTDYVTLTRIQFAANLLRYHHYAITQAAQEVGIPVVPYPPVQAHHRRDAVPLRPVESHRGLRDEPVKKKNFAAALIQPPCNVLQHSIIICIESVSCVVALARGCFMILQTGFRTDIPAFYSAWFANRLRAGFVLVRNPYDPQSVTRYAINPDVVDLIGFCTKNPAPMLPRMELLRPYGQYWFVTITPYGPEIEPYVPPKAQVLQDFITLSKIVGPDCIAWRYDPIFLSDTYTATRHIAEFEQMAAVLSGYTKTCVISFIDLYEKVRRNFPQVKSVLHTERETLGKAFIEIGRKYGMTIRPCAEGTALARYGADCSGCMTQKTFEAALHRPLRLPPQKPARRECACCLTADIGAYNTCGHGCLYCYANASRVAVAQNMRMHDPFSPFLVGHSQPGDVIHEAKQESWLVDQISMAELL